MITFHESEVKLAGSPLSVGAAAPKVALVAGDLSSVEVGGASGKYQIINVVPSLDTGVCQIQAKRFNKEAAALKNAEVFVISMDLPFAQKRFCSTEGVENLKTLSDYRDRAFAKAYGLLLETGPIAGLLTRAVIVVDPSGKIAYQEVCSEVTNEPDYAAALNAVK